MIRTTEMLLADLNDYAYPANRLNRLVRQGACTKIVRGLYETNAHTPGYLLAGSIYGPSYLSFDFALARYGLIPEAVCAFTCATFEKKKKKVYETPFGRYLYQDVPAQAFPLEIKVQTEQDYFYLIATPEKALCDKLYTLSPVQNQKQLEALLFDDLRIDLDEYAKLNRKTLTELCGHYHSANLNLFSHYIRRTAYEYNL